MTPAETFAEQGPLARLISDYAPRIQQIEMAEAIDSAFSNRESLICEAGTGTGKSFAYLVPAILSGLKVLISTGTRHLQDQLYERDLPLVQAALRLPVNVALLKGRANYLCNYRAKLLRDQPPELEKKTLSQLMQVLEWSVQTTSGDLAELIDIPENARIRALAVSTAENCLGQACPDYDDCFVFAARRAAMQADIVIVNHHLFFADLALRELGHGELLPAADVVIFDEAHQIPALATQFFSRRISSHQLFELSRDCKAGYFAEAGDLPEFLVALDKLEKAIMDLRLVLPRREQRQEWADLRHTKDVNMATDELMARMQALQQILGNLAERGKLLDNCYRRMAELSDLFADFCESGNADHVQWLETNNRAFVLHETPLDISINFQRRIENDDFLCVYTSATLSVNRSFEYFASRLGLQGVAASSWDSPFDFRRQALLYLPDSLPDPRVPGYTELVIEAALPVLRLTRGRAFFLFTSHRALRIAADLIPEQIDYPVLIQGGAPRTELLESFRSTPHAVLLGTSSFWEGVDVRGQALSCVIIDKLPFASPDDPVLRARMKKLEEEGGNPFMDFQVPEAVIDLRQGIGRLIRDSADYGVLMVCDPRLRTRPYGSIFLRSLPQMERTGALARVKEFFAAHDSAMAEARQS